MCVSVGAGSFKRLPCYTRDEGCVLGCRGGQEGEREETYQPKAQSCSLGSSRLCLRRPPQKWIDRLFCGGKAGWSARILSLVCQKRVVRDFPRCSRCLVMLLGEGERSGGAYEDIVSFVYSSS